MQNKNLDDEIIALINREVVPAVGCTEPAAVALCVAKAKEVLGSVPEKIEVALSGNMLKNAMGVGIPGTGMIGLPIAIALGAIMGESANQLEVLGSVTLEDVENGKKYIAEDKISISHYEDSPSNLYIDVKVSDKEGNVVEVIISEQHTNFIYIQKNGEVLLNKENEAGPIDDNGNSDPQLNMKMVWDFSQNIPLEKIKFILEAKRLNKAASELAMRENFGHSLGSTMKNKGIKFFGDSVLAHIISATSSACDARMGGAQVAVMSNSGSGNQGICATMPVVSFAEDINADEEHLARALILSHLTSIYIKQSLGRLSALCGCVVASTGASSGIVYLMGGGFSQVCAAVKNMIANITGIICDGAKPSCSLKISSGVSTALMSAMLAMNEKCVTQAEGIISDDVDVSIHNLTSIGRDAMKETDKLVLHIMTHK